MDKLMTLLQPNYLVYFGAFALIAGLAYPLLIKNPTNKKKIIYIIVVFAYLWLLSVLRYDTGNDYINYNIIQRRFFNLDGFFDIFAQGVEPGFAIVDLILSFFTKDVVVANGFYAVIVLVPVAYAIYKHSKNIWLSCFLYMCLTFFYCSLNFVRQSIAASIILLAYHYAIEKNSFKVCIMVMLATCFHSTAVIFLVLYFLTFIKPKRKIMLIYAGAITVLYLTSNYLINWGIDFTKLFTDKFSGYQNSKYLTVGLGGQYLIVPFIILIITMLAYYGTWGKKCKEANFCMYMMLFNATIWLFITKHYILERFSMFEYIFVLFSLPSIINFYRTYDGEYEPSPVAKWFIKIFGDKKTLKTRRAKANTLLVIVVVSCFIYNNYSMLRNFHGDFPYQSIFPSVESMKYSGMDVEELTDTLQEEQLIYNYLLELNQSDYAYIVTFKKDGVNGMNSVIKRTLGFMGFKTDFSDEMKNSSFVAINDGEKMVLEQVSDEKIVINQTLGDTEFVITSAGKNVGKTSSVLVNGIERSMDNTGMNIIVFDPDTNTVIDSISFRTATARMKFSRTYNDPTLV